MRVAVLAGGRSSEHEVSLNSAASVREGVAAAGHEVLPVTIERAGDWALRGRGARRCGRAAGCSAPTPSSRCCTARSARTARCRACWSCSTCPTSARACSPRRCAWTRSSSRRCWPPPTCRRWPTRACALARWRAEPEAVLRELAVLGTPVFVKPARLGSSVGHRQGLVRGRARPGARRGLRPRLAGDRRGLLGRHGGRVLGARQRRARGLGPRRDRAHRLRLVRLRGQVPAGRHGARRARPAARAPCSRRCAGWPATRSCASAARAWPASTSSSRTASACSSTSSTRCPGFTATSVYPKLWEAVGLPFPALCDRLLALALERFETSAGRTRQAQLLTATRRLPGTGGSRRSRRCRRRRRAW